MFVRSIENGCCRSLQYRLFSLLSSSKIYRFVFAFVCVCHTAAAATTATIVVNVRLSRRCALCHHRDSESVSQSAIYLKINIEIETIASCTPHMHPLKAKWWNMDGWLDRLMDGCLLPTWIFVVYGNELKLHTMNHKRSLIPVCVTLHYFIHIVIINFILNGKQPCCFPPPFHFTWCFFSLFRFWRFFFALFRGVLFKFETLSLKRHAS